MIALLVDGDEEFLDLLVLRSRSQVNHVGIARTVEGAGVAALIEVDEVVGVDGLSCASEGLLTLTSSLSFI